LRVRRFVLVVCLILAASLGGCSVFDAPPKPPPVVVEPPSPPAPPALKEIEGLVDVTALDATLVIDLRYATADNFTGEEIYSEAECLLLKATAEKLIAAQKEFAELGYRIKIWDAYRPLSAQRALWEVVGDPAFVADPKKGSIHNRGAAVDVTLVDKDGKEISMPTGFDDFTEKAAIDYGGCTKEQAVNRELLASVMVKHGFTRLEAEWWHFVDKESSGFPLLDVQFDQFK
jgi:D-alanyl-D-alanine dipeptidase